MRRPPPVHICEGRAVGAGTLFTAPSGNAQSSVVLVMVCGVKTAVRKPRMLGCPDSPASHPPIAWARSEAASRWPIF
jgi:hypothetical protein